MAKLNTSGRPSVDHYNLGRGKLLFGEALSPTTGKPTKGYRHLGNATEISLSVESETLEHQSSRGGIKVVDKEVAVSQKAQLKVTLDELMLENLGAFLSGTSQAGVAGDNAAVAGFVEYQMITGVMVGRHYDIVDSGGKRAIDIVKANVTVRVGASTKVLDTDYEVDEKMGLLFIMNEGSSTIVDSDDVLVTLAADAGAKAPQTVYGLTSASIVGALKFVSENPVDADSSGVGEQKEYQMHQVTLKADGEMALIGDDWSTLSLSGTLEKNELADASSPTITVTSYDQG